MKKRYIIRTKTNRMPGLMMSTQLGLKKREEQIEEVLKFHNNNKNANKLQSWISKHKINVLNKLGITGVRILDLSNDEENSIRDSLGEDIEIYPDRNIALVRPSKRGDVVNELEKIDLWHLDAVKKRNVDIFGKATKIAVLDTGIDGKHLDIKENIVESYVFKKAKMRSRKKSLDSEGHGTHVAGLICGKNTGIAPGVEIVDIQVLHGEGGLLSDLVLALDWIGQRADIQVVNGSLGIVGFEAEMRDSISYLVGVGVLPVFAVGNEGSNVTSSPGNYPEVLSVGAIDQQEKIPSYSSSGRIIDKHHIYEVPTLVAPGHNVFSCSKGGGYIALSGTSMAAPIISGVAALTIEKYGPMDVSAVIDRIKEHCEKLVGVDELRQGKGLVNLESLLR